MIEDLYIRQLDKEHRQIDLLTMEPAMPFQTRFLATVLRNPKASYFMVGPLRIGKTWLAAAQYSFLSKQGLKCFWRTAAQFCDEIQTHYAPRDDEFVHSPILLAMKTYAHVHVFIDDIDKLSFSRTEFRKERAYDFFNSMMTKGFGLTTTSNHNFIELQEDDLLPPSVVRRIGDICVLLDYKGAQ